MCGTRSASVTRCRFYVTHIALQMGLLGLEKAEKSSRVQLDLKRQRLALGFAPKPRKRKLVDMQNSTSTSAIDNDDTPDLNTAREAALVLNTVEFSAVNAKLVSESDEDRALDATEAAEAFESLSQANTTRAAPRTNIPLEDLFLYPSSTYATPWGRVVEGRY